MIETGLKELDKFLGGGIKDGKAVEKFGRVILRGNNVLFIKLENEL